MRCFALSFLSLEVLVVLLLGQKGAEAQFYHPLGGFQHGIPGLHAGGLGVPGFHNPFMDPFMNDPFLDPYWAHRHPHVVQPQVIINRRHQNGRRSTNNGRTRGLFPKDSAVFHLDAFPPADSPYMWLILLLRNKGQSTKTEEQLQSLVTALENLAKSVHNKVSYRVAALDCQSHDCSVHVPSSMLHYRVVAGSDSALVFMAEGIAYPVDKGTSLTAKGLNAFCRDNMPTEGLVHTLSASQGSTASVKDWLVKARQDGKDYGIVLVSKQKGSSKLFTVLAHMYRQQAAFAEVAAKDEAQMLSEWKDQANLHEMAASDSLLMALSTRNNQVIRYMGELKGQEIANWIRLDVLQKQKLNQEEKSRRQQDRAKRREEKLKQHYPEEMDQISLSLQIPSVEVLQDGDEIVTSSSYGTVVVSKRSKPEVPTFPFSNDLVRKYGRFFRFAEYNTNDFSVGRLFLDEFRGKSIALAERPSKQQKEKKLDISFYQGARKTLQDVSAWLESKLVEVPKVHDLPDIYSFFLPRSRTTGCGLLLVGHSSNDAERFEAIAESNLGNFSYAKLAKPNVQVLEAFLTQQEIDKTMFSPAVIALWSDVSRVQTVYHDFYSGPINDKSLKAFLEKLRHQAKHFSVPATKDYDVISRETRQRHAPETRERKNTAEENKNNASPQDTEHAAGGETRVDEWSVKLPYRHVKGRAVYKIRTERELHEQFLDKNPDRQELEPFTRSGSIIALYGENSPLPDGFEALVDKFGDFYRFGEINVTENQEVARAFFRDGKPADGYPCFCLFHLDRVQDMSAHNNVAWYGGSPTETGLVNWVDEFIGEVRHLHDFEDFVGRLLLPSVTTGSALLFLDYDETSLKKFEAIVAERPHKSIYGKIIGPVRATLQKLDDLGILEHKGPDPILLFFQMDKSRPITQVRPVKKQYLVGGISNRASVLEWLDKHQLPARLERVVASPLLVEAEGTIDVDEHAVLEEEEMSLPNIESAESPDLNVEEFVDLDEDEVIDLDNLEPPLDEDDIPKLPNDFDDETLDIDEESEPPWWWHVFATPRVFRYLYESIQSMAKRDVATIFACAGFLALLRLLPLGKTPGWLTSFERGADPGSNDIISNFIQGMLYVHQHYLEIVLFVGLRTVLVLVIVGGVLIEIALRFEAILLSDLVLFVANLGRWASLFYFVSCIMLLDVTSAAVLIVKHGVSSLGSERIKEFLAIASVVLEESSHALETLVKDPSKIVPSSVLVPELFMYIGHPLGFYHHHGGFPGINPFHFHHPGLMPGGFYGVPRIPQQIIVEERVIVEQDHRRPYIDQEQQQQIETADALYAVMEVVFHTLVLAPIVEEIVFRFGLGIVRRVAGRDSANDRCRPVCGGQTWGNILVSLIFAAAHLGNHIPDPTAVPELLQQGNDRVTLQLRFALLQFGVTLFLSLRVFLPLYQRYGLVAAMGAHATWNGCAFFIQGQVAVRTAFLVAGACYARAITTFWKKEKLDTASPSQATQVAPDADTTESSIRS